MNEANFHAGAETGADDAHASMLSPGVNEAIFHTGTKTGADDAPASLLPPGASTGAMQNGMQDRLCLAIMVRMQDHLQHMQDCRLARRQETHLETARYLRQIPLRLQ